MYKKTMHNSRRSIRSAQKSSGFWALCAHRTGNECPTLGLSMPKAWSLSAQGLVPECPLDGQDRLFTLYFFHPKMVASQIFLVFL